MTSGSAWTICSRLIHGDGAPTSPNKLTPLAAAKISGNQCTPVIGGSIHSTIEHGALPATGIPFVVVNGVIVVKESKVLKGVYPGKPIRLPEMATSK